MGKDVAQADRMTREVPTDAHTDPDRGAAGTRPRWPFARHRHECVTGRLTSHLWSCRGWRCAGYLFRACRRHQRVRRHSSPR
jgi:hypothetical protein